MCLSSIEKLQVKRSIQMVKMGKNTNQKEG